MRRSLSMKKAFIVVNAYTENLREFNQPNRIKAEFEKRGVEMKVLRNSPLVLKEEGDFCIYLDKDKYTARMLERRMRLFNSAEAIELCDDKMLTVLALDGFPCPKTIPSLLCYTPQAPVSRELIGCVEGGLGFPVVVKECFGSLGMQVYLVQNRKELDEISERLKLKPHLYQEFIKESAGRDLRVIVVGGKAVAAMKRVSESDFRSNVELGGKGEKFVLDDAARELCEKIAARLKLDYCGIDLLFGKEGYLVCEVNSNAFFGGIEKVTGVDVAKAYADHIYREIYG